MPDQEISASEFKATCLKLLDRVAETGAEVVVTKRGKPVAKVVPVEDREAIRERLREDLRGSVTFLVDDDELIKPIDVEWDALR